MTIEARKQYLAAIHLRYKNATRKEQGLILDEFYKVCGYTRKHAIRLLGRPDSVRQSKPGPRPKYGDEVIEHLLALWKLMNYMCSIKMKEAIPIWLPYYRQSDCGKLSELQTQRLLADRELLDPLRLKRGLDTKLRLFGERLHKLQQGMVRIKSDEAA